MLIDSNGRSGEVATLHLHWQSTPLGRQGGLAFQTTERIPFDEGTKEEILVSARKDVETAANVDLDRRYQYLQGARILWRGRPEVVLFKIARPS